MRRWIGLTGLVLGLLLLVGCGGPMRPTPAAGETVPVVSQADRGTVVAEAVIEPARWVELRFDSGGRVAEVLVAPGDRVEAGDPLVRLDTAAMELALQKAEQEYLAQKAALDQQVAQAEIELEIRQQELEKARLQDPNADVAAAEARVKQLQMQLAKARAEDPTPNVITARVEYSRTQIALQDAQTEYNKALDRPWEPQEVRDGYAKALQQAQLNFEAAKARLQQALDTQRAHALSLSVLAAQVDEAQAQLNQAIATQQTYTVTLKIMEAQVEAARLQLDGLRSSGERVSEAEARLRQAEIAVEELKLDLQKAELQAPFAGTVVDVRVEVGEQVNPGQVVVVLATLDRLQARTTDLTELDVVRVREGQPAVVTVDALPDQEFAGVVRRVALQGQEYRGDVTYAVTVELTDPEQAQALRWGMTAVVEIKTED